MTHPQAIDGFDGIGELARGFSQHMRLPPPLHNVPVALHDSPNLDSTKNKAGTA